MRTIMTTVKVFLYKYEVLFEDDNQPQYYCETYDEAYELLCELVSQGYEPLLRLNKKFSPVSYMAATSSATKETLRKIINREV